MPSNRHPELLILPFWEKLKAIKLIVYRNIFKSALDSKEPWNYLKLLIDFARIAGSIPSIKLLW